MPIPESICHELTEVAADVSLTAATPAPDYVVAVEQLPEGALHALFVSRRPGHQARRDMVVD
jgi:hypothetical protein